MQDLIFAYTVEDALADGTLVDAHKLPGGASDCTRERFKGNPVYLTAALYRLIERAVAHPRHCNDWQGVWWDILWMAGAAIRSAVREAKRTGQGWGYFRVIITGTGRRRYHDLKVSLNGDGLTFLLEGED